MSIWKEQGPDLECLLFRIIFGWNFLNCVCFLTSSSWNLHTMQFNVGEFHALNCLNPMQDPHSSSIRALDKLNHQMAYGQVINIGARVRKYLFFRFYLSLLFGFPFSEWGPRLNWNDANDAMMYDHRSAGGNCLVF